MWPGAGGRAGGQAGASRPSPATGAGPSSRQGEVTGTQEVTTCSAPPAPYTRTSRRQPRGHKVIIPQQSPHITMPAIAQFLATIARLLAIMIRLLALIARLCEACEM